MNQKSLITFLVIVIIILTGTAVYLATKQAEPLSQPTSEVVPETSTQENGLPSRETSSEPAEMKDWQTYTENTTGFSIQYPNGWPVREPAPSDCGENKICEIAFGNLPQAPDDTAAIQNLVNVLVHSPGSIAGNGGDGTTNCENARTVTLDSGLTAETKECVNDMGGSRQYFYTFKKSGWWYQIISSKGSEAAKIFYDMANSFAFTK
jgi:hypothetical protein